MDRKYYTGEQILDALSEVGVSAGDISEVMSCLGRMPSAEPRCIATIQLSQEQLDEAFEKVKADILSVKPKTGKWLKHKHENIEHVECSNCKAWFLDKYFIHKSYCPNCGSYNGGEDD